MGSDLSLPSHMHRQRHYVLTIAILRVLQIADVEHDADTPLLGGMCSSYPRLPHSTSVKE
jgi:hypothetical protein